MFGHPSIRSQEANTFSFFWSFATQDPYPSSLDTSVPLSELQTTALHRMILQDFSMCLGSAH